MSKAFASQADLEEKTVSFTKLSDHAYAYTAEGDPNTGIVVGDDAVMVIDTQATPAMAQDVIRRIREVTDKPIKYVVLSHYHAVRVLGASAYRPEHVIASEDTLSLIRERGEQDKASEIGRFPRLFRNVESGEHQLAAPQHAHEGVGVGQRDRAAGALAHVGDRQQRLDGVLADVARQRRVRGGGRLQEQARGAAVIQGQAPAVGVRPLEAAAQGQAGEGEHDVGRNVALHPEQFAHRPSQMTTAAPGL